VNHQAVTDQEKLTVGLQLTVILLVVLNIALRAISQHPEWFG
jgi:hypothetical protein